MAICGIVTCAAELKNTRKNNINFAKIGFGLCLREHDDIFSSVKQ